MVFNNYITLCWLHITGKDSVTTYTLPLSLDIKAYAGIDGSYMSNVGHPGVISYTNTNISVRFGNSGRLIIIGI